MFTPVLRAIRFSPFSIHFLFFSYYKVGGLQDKKMMVMTKGGKKPPHWKVLCSSRFKRSAPARDKRTGLGEPCLWKISGSYLCDALWRLVFRAQNPATAGFTVRISQGRMGCAALQCGINFYKDASSILRLFTWPWTMKQHTTRNTCKHLHDRSPSHVTRP